jgi:NTP pyrophosphatase (non-canonical NTP hydrolase)
VNKHTEGYRDVLDIISEIQNTAKKCYCSGESLKCSARVYPQVGSVAYIIKCSQCGKEFSGTKPADLVLAWNEWVKSALEKRKKEILEAAGINLSKSADAFLEVWNKKQFQCYLTSVDNGWHESTINFPAFIALCHSELSEALEWARNGTLLHSDHIPDFLGIEEELADVVIRIMDYAEKEHLRVAEAIIAKNEFNKNRGHKHGGKKF